MTNDAEKYLAKHPLCPSLDGIQTALTFLIFLVLQNGEKEATFVYYIYLN